MVTPMQKIILTLAALMCLVGSVEAQDLPPVVVPTTEPKAGTDWVLLATTIGGFVTNWIFMILTFLKANTASSRSYEALGVANRAQDATVFNRELLMAKPTAILEPPKVG